MIRLIYRFSTDHSINCDKINLNHDYNDILDVKYDMNAFKNSVRPFSYTYLFNVHVLNFI